MDYMIFQSKCVEQKYIRQLHINHSLKPIMGSFSLLSSVDFDKIFEAALSALVKCLTDFLRSVSNNKNGTMWQLNEICSQERKKRMVRNLIEENLKREVNHRFSIIIKDINGIYKNKQRKVNTRGHLWSTTHTIVEVHPKSKSQFQQELWRKGFENNALFKWYSNRSLHMVSI